MDHKNKFYNLVPVLFLHNSKTPNSLSKVIVLIKSLGKSFIASIIAFATVSLYSRLAI